MKYIIITLLLIASDTILYAQHTNLKSTDRLAWQKISETVADFGQQGAELIIVERERFGSVHFRVKEAQVEIKNIEIYYDNGDKQDVVLNEVINTNKNSRIINLMGQDRRILKKVVFRFKSLPHTDDKRAEVELWGSKARVKAINKTINRTKTAVTTRR